MDISVWILLGLLVLGLMGFGIGNYSGIANTIGKVGSEEITVDEYYTALQDATNNLARTLGTALSYQDAIAIGASQEALASITRDAAMDDELHEIGLSVGDEAIFKTITDNPGFQGVDGSFDRTLYELTLQNNNTTKSEYDEIIRKEFTRNLLLRAIAAGIEPPQYYLDKSVEHAFQRRTYQWVEITDAFLTHPDPQGTEAELRQHYDANPDAYTLPSTQEITFVWLLPEMQENSLIIPDEDLLALYEASSELYDIPETRALDRLIFANPKAAQEAFDAVQEGTKEFDDIAAEKGILPEDLDLGLVSYEELPDSVADMVFGTDELIVVGPVEIELGTALFRINAIVPPQYTPFEDAKEELRSRKVEEMAQDMISDSIETYNNILAAGATLEELADETELVLGRISYSSLSTDRITDFAAFRTAARSLTEDSFPEIIELDNGGVVALRLDATKAPFLQPFDDVREQVVDDWGTGNLLQQKIDLAEENRTALEAGVELGKIGLGQVIMVVEQTRLEAPENTPDWVHEAAFELESANTATVVNDGDSVMLALLTDILPADRQDQLLAQALPQFEVQLKQGMSVDYYNLYTQELLNTKEFLLNDDIINSIHAQLQ